MPPSLSSNLPQNAKTDQFGNQLSVWSTFSMVGTIPAGSLATFAAFDLDGFGQKRFSVFNIGTTAFSLGQVQSSPDGTNGWNNESGTHIVALPAGSRYSFNSNNPDSFWRLTGSTTVANVAWFQCKASQNFGTFA